MFCVNVEIDVFLFFIDGVFVGFWDCVEGYFFCFFDLKCLV